MAIGRWQSSYDGTGELVDAAGVLGTGADDGTDTEAAKFVGRQCAPQIAFVDDEYNWFFTAKCLLGDVAVAVAGVLGAVDDH